ncbi:MAG: hypothetical protein KDA21_07760 [Phycisphaerales bacterium]|nr:hypothetical protein [Phycisphaerales bacterium]
MKLTASLFALGLCLAPFAGTAQAQSATPGMTGTPVVQAVRDPRGATLARMMRPITTELENARLEDIVQFVSDFTGADIDAKWSTDRSGIGLDPDFEVTISVAGVECLTFLERVLEKAEADDFVDNTWQLSEDGFLEIGPKEVLNKSRTLVVYDINDLLFQIPNFGNVPTLDLDSILDQGQQGGGGGGSSFFEDEGDQNSSDIRSTEELAEQIMDLIMELVEPEQWVDNGGEGATMDLYQGTLLIKAPDYIHRQINGYDFWPKPSATARRGGRYMTFGLDAQNSTGQFRNTRTYGTASNGAAP